MLQVSKKASKLSWDWWFSQVILNLGEERDIQQVNSDVPCRPPYADWCQHLSIFRWQCRHLCCWGWLSWIHGEYVHRNLRHIHRHSKWKWTTAHGCPVTLKKKLLVWGMAYWIRCAYPDSLAATKVDSSLGRSSTGISYVLAADNCKSRRLYVCSINPDLALIYEVAYRSGIRKLMPDLALM